MKNKKIIYISLAIFLGVILSFIVHGIVEIIYINSFLKEDALPKPATLTHLCYLPLFLQVFLLLAGVLGGYFLGNFWWKTACKKKNK